MTRRALVTNTAARASLSSSVLAATSPGHLAIELLRSALGAGLDDRGLVAEVLVHRAARDVGGPCDVDDGRLVQAVPAEAVERGLDDEFAGVGRGRAEVMAVSVRPAQGSVRLWVRPFRT